MRQSDLHGDMQKSAEMTDSAKRVATMIEKMHWEDRKSLRDVAKALGLTWSGLQWYLRTYNIPRKERVQSMRDKFGEQWTHHKGERLIAKRSGDKTRKTSHIVLLKKPGHPNANPRGYILEHRFVMAEKLGRPLRTEEIVHHKDGNPMNNALDNLEVRLRGYAEDQPHGPLTVCPNCGHDLFSR